MGPPQPIELPQPFWQRRNVMKKAVAVFGEVLGKEVATAA